MCRASKRVELSEMLTNDPILGAFRAQVESTIPMNNSPQMRNIWEPTTVALKKILMGGATAEEAAEAAERRYAAITREPPAETSPKAYFILVAILLGAALIIGYRWIRGVTRRGEFGEFLTGLNGLAQPYLLPAYLYLSHSSRRWGSASFLMPMVSTPLLV